MSGPTLLFGHGWVIFDNIWLPEAEYGINLAR